ncbi:MAG: serine hydrolase [Flavobacteriales bacterium]|nr:serine hydrolase [Flavobacteriales bacterium]
MKSIGFKIALVVSLLLPFALLFAPEQKSATDSWAETKLSEMTLDEKIAQLMMIEVRPTYGQAHLDAVRNTVDKYQVGGIILFKGEPLSELRLTNDYQSISKTPLMVAIDGEWGLAMRLSNTTSFPYQMGLGGIADNDIIFQMGRQIGRQCRRMGIHVNFAPVVDVNNNPKNPVINYRSFGESRENVAAKGWAYAKGMQTENVIACAKHFPGHGDTDVDSHKDLPVINHSRERLDSIELYPFRSLIDSGVMSIMTAHLYIPAIDNRANTAISISEKGINGLLRNELGFNGLAFTDALNMQGVAKFYQPGELELKALIAGNDILLGPTDVPKAIQVIKNAVATGKISQEYIDSKVLKVLYAKQWLGLDNYEPAAEENLLEELNSNYATFLLNSLISKQLCVVQDQDNLLPISVNSKAKIATLSVGGGLYNEFQKTIEHYHAVQHFEVSSAVSANVAANMKSKLKDYDLIIVSMHNTSRYPKNNYGVNLATAKFLKELNHEKKCVFVDFGNPYNLAFFDGMKTVVMAYQDDKTNQTKAAQMLFGAIPADAFLPVSVSQEFKLYSKSLVPDLQILQFGEPAEVGMSEKHLLKIDSIAKDAISNGAMPGCQILVAKDGKVVYQKSFGKHTYNGSRMVVNDDLYDLASITKVNATTLAVMKLVEDSVMKINDPLAKYLPDLDTTNKNHITIKQVLTHTAGLKPFIPFYEATISDPIAYDTIYSKIPSEKFCVKVADNLYMCKDYQKVVFGEIYDSDVKNPGNYNYSDLGMMLMRFAIENVTHTPFDRYVDSVFYQPMGLRTMTFKPLDKFDLSEIVPTEDNADFRRTLVHGYVHDPGAAMLGGVSGHAGLFSNSADVAAVLQMLLNGGYYNGKQLLHAETIKEFTKYQFADSRRGLGFDKPENDRRKVNPASDYASYQCFGHSGFTGTIMWADPANGLVYVFLSNRVYPTAENKKLVSMGVRTKIMDVIYESLD